MKAGLAVSLFLVACGRSPSGSIQDGRDLEALAETRPGPGRLSGMPWAPYSPADQQRNAKALLQAERRADAALAASRTGQTLRESGVVALFKGDLDRAIDDLSEATERSPTDAGLWSDLGAACLQRGEALAEPHYFVLALAAAERALAIDPTLTVALFNRAVAFERLSLRRQASADWKRLLTMEKEIQWTREAQSQLSSTEREGSVRWSSTLDLFRQVSRKGGNRGRLRAIVMRLPQRFREYAAEELLPSWASQEGPEAEQSLSLARSIGAALGAAGGDPLIAETVAQIDRLGREGPGRLRELRQALQMYGKGIALLHQEAFTEARPFFRESRATLEKLHSPFGGWAAFQAAYCENRRFDLREARALLTKLVEMPELPRYRALHGRVFWVLGLIDAVEGSLSASTEHLEVALTDFEALGEKDNAARLRANKALNLDYLGRRTEAWRELFPVLREVDRLGLPAQNMVWHIAASLAYEQGELRVAQAFVDQLASVAKVTEQVAFVVEALRWRAVILSKIGEAREAAACLREARSYQTRIPDAPSRENLGADLLLAEAELAVTASPGEVISALDPAIRTFRSIGYHYQLGHALSLRAAAEKQLGRDDDVERDLADAIAETERQREKILAPRERILYLDQRRELLDRMVAFQIDRRQPMEALRFGEEAKARVLWDWIITQPGNRSHQDSGLIPSHNSELTEDLPKSNVVVVYTTLPDRTAIWLLRNGEEPRMFVAGTGAGKVGQQVQSLRTAVEEGEASDLVSLSESLYDVLIRPVEQEFLPGDRLVFVPDGSLHALPFGLLQNRKSGRYLIQDHVCSVAPSIRTFKASLQRQRVLGGRSTARVLMVLDPDFDVALYPTLGRLRGAAEEKAVAMSFLGSEVLRDRNATRSAFLSRAGDFEIVHFGGHSVVNSEFPLLSQMVFARESGHPSRGVLYSEDILLQRLRRTRLVILASCATADGRISRTEGVESLARPFLAVGVPTVVASLWSVGDKDTGEFFSRFYRWLGSGLDPAAALRAAQVEELEQGADMRRLRTWSAFEVIGGSAAVR